MLDTNPFMINHFIFRRSYDEHFHLMPLLPKISAHSIEVIP